MTPALAWNTAVSFVTNTNWQAYSGRVDHEPSGANGRPRSAELRVCRGRYGGRDRAGARIRAQRTGDLGNFWVDLVRGTLRILLPICVVAAIILIAGGAVRISTTTTKSSTRSPGPSRPSRAEPWPARKPSDPRHQRRRLLQRQLRASVREPHHVDQLGGDLPAAGDQLLAARTFGRMVGSTKQGFAIAAVMTTLAFISWSMTMWMQLQAHGTVPSAVGSAMEGVEQRFGVANWAVFAASTTLTSTGSVALSTTRTPASAG